MLPVFVLLISPITCAIPTLVLSCILGHSTFGEVHVLSSMMLCPGDSLCFAPAWTLGIVTQSTTWSHS